MFFEPQIIIKDKIVSLDSGATVQGEGHAAFLANKLIGERGVLDGDIKRILFNKSLPDGMTVEAGDETYALVITEDSAELYGLTDRALIYAAVTLVQMSNHDGIYTGRIEDAPDCSFRGYRVFLPGRKSFADFYAMVDTLVYYKYNYLSIEIGGAMEYKRHPEINEAWREYVKETNRYSGRAQEIQKKTYPWQKNSIHTCNGDGDVLTQDEVRELVAYCKERCITVYPEVPTLSHCDYICIAHPELREREEDDVYPDTYCPNHPDVYNIVFDILEEVIDVFKPALINIGHDEYYSIGLCPRCKDEMAHELFSKDVKKIHGFLKEKGIRTAMWAEKLLPAVTAHGKVFGGAGNGAFVKPGEINYIPETYYCQYTLPRDILMINWYYIFGLQTDFVYHTHGYEMILGNMSAYYVDSWRERRNFGAKGGCCSNWGSNAPEYMQRNNQYLNLIFGAFATWSKTYCNERKEEIRKKAYDEAFHYRYGNPSEKPYIKVVHTTPLNIPYKVFYDGVFIEDELYHMGNYKATYGDGTTELFEVKYGTNISSIALEVDGELEYDPEDCLDNTAIGEVSYSTLPVSINGKTYYKTLFSDPHPEKELVSFEYVPDTESEVITLSFERTR